MNYKKIIRNIIKYGGRILLLYLLFALIGSTLPYAFRKTVSDENKVQLNNVTFYSDTVGSERISLIETPEDAYSIRLSLLQEAQSTLDISYLSIDKGATTDVFLGELLKAADRGVEVRIILDGIVGSPSSNVSGSLTYLNAHENISYRVYNPIRPFTPWKWHTLLHDKFILADGQYLLLGGRNINDKYFAPSGYEGEITNDRDVFIWNTTPTSDDMECSTRQTADYMNLLWNAPDTVVKKAGKNETKRTEIYESLLTVTGSFASANTKFYDKTLHDFKEETVTTNKITLIRNPVHATKKEPWIGYQLYQLCLDADSVVLQTPYATGNKDMLNCFDEIAADTDSFTMVTNSLASTPNYPAFSNYYAQRKKFIATGATIYEYQSYNSIHGKSLIINERLSAVGSLNMDERSLYIDTETMLLIDSPEFAEILGTAIDDIIDTSLLLNEDNDYIENPEVEELTVSSTKKFVMRIVSIPMRIFQFLI